jgi:hypothetical protein
MRVIPSSMATSCTSGYESLSRALGAILPPKRPDAARNASTMIEAATEGPATSITVEVVT